MNSDDKRVCPVCGMSFPASKEFCPVCAFRAALKTDVNATEVLVSSSSELRFDHYEILKHDDQTPFELGRGAMGITYKAFDVDLRRLAALKVINPRYVADESARLRFLREARAAASVRHPNVASVFHLGESGANCFYAMEFVQGETLENLIKRSGRLEAKRALEIVAQIAAGLGAIHKENVVHRDIKPSNLMVSSADGDLSVKIIDLGLAKLTESESQVVSMPGAFAGTPEFASPEQFTGADVDIRSDLYSLGATLWQMLTGEPPFRGNANAVMQQHLNSPLPLEKLREVAQPVVALVQVLLRKDRARRFRTPAELLKVLPAIVAAIDTERAVRKTVRVLVSSSSDVQTERNLAKRIAQSIAGEFDLPMADPSSDYERLVEADLLSEHEGDENAGEQEHHELVLCLQFSDFNGQGEVKRLPDPGDFDLVVCIAGSRLGLPVHRELKLPDGSVPTSETEYLLAWVTERVSRNDGFPVLRVYRNRLKLAFPLEPKEEPDLIGKNLEPVPDLFAKWEDKRTGTSHVHGYKSLEEFEEQFRTHFRSFLTDQIKLETGPQSQSRKVRRWKSSPFRGLKVFDFEHAPIFFGRTRAVGEVLEALEQQRKVWRPFVLIVGASGSGKSSLVRAGVLPLLIQPATFDDVGLWRRAVTRPGAGGSGGDCFDALANSLLESTALPGFANPESTNAVQDLAAELRDHPDAVALRVRDALDNAAREWKTQRANYLRAKDEKLRSTGQTTVRVPIPQRETPELPKARLALVIDQLEELFTSGFSSEIQQKYVSTIAGLVQSARVFVIATLRSDFYSSYQQFPELTELTRPSGKVDLRPPSAYEIGNMIRLPAEAANLQFEQDNQRGQRLDEGLRDAAAATPESLPLLEHVLSLLYDKQTERGDGLLRWSDYRDLGELKGALAKYAEAVFATLPPTEQLAFPLVMRHLVTLGQGEEEAPNRRTVPYRDFIASNGLKSGAKGFVDLFIQKRLFVSDTDPHGEANVSVAHEALLREWQRIRDWLSENREFLRMRDRLDSSVKLWLSRGKQKDDLLGPGLPLAEGEKLLEDFQPSLSQTQTDYVRASVAEQKRRQRTRERIRYGVIAGITSALIIAIIFGVVSYRQFRRAERAKVAADQAAKRATLARDEAQKLINFMTIDLRDKLNPIGRLDLLDDVNQRVRAYYDHLAGSDNSPEILWQRSIAQANYADIRKDQGDLAAALDSYREALAVQKKLVLLSPKNRDWRHDLSATLGRIGDVLKHRGDTDGALENYQESLRIRQELAAEDPADAGLQRDLSDSFERIGDARNDQGNAAGALENYRKALPIREKLALSNPRDAALQLDLSWSYENIGWLLSTAGDSDGALQNYRSAVTIRQKLADQDPKNATFQHDLSSSFAEVGYELLARGDLAEALDADRKALAITRGLVAIDPSNAMCKRDLSINLERVGDVLKAQDDLSGALASHEDALEIRKELVRRDADNTLSEADIAWSYQEIGDVLLAQKKLPEAQQNYEESLAITQRLAKADPANNERQSELANISEKAAEASAAQGNYTAAIPQFRASLAICEKLTDQDPKNSRWAADKALACFGLGTALSHSESESSSEARTMLVRARDMLLDLKQRSPLSPQNQNRLKQIETALNSLRN
jgi:serine/threonine protein kinase/tetratricopeptide (TPR) repeat protein